MNCLPQGDIFMSRKAKYSKQQKLKACNDYLSGKKTISEIASSLGMGKSSQKEIPRWANMYKVYGADIFDDKPHNKAYSKELKARAVKEHIDGKSSLNDICVKYKILSHRTLLNWIKKYNSHVELKDYDPKGEVYMKDSRKTTYEERTKIVKWCLDHGRNFKDAASHFDCSYSQVRSWVLKYEASGKEGLVDRRGKPKEEKELSELELANKKIQRLEREKEDLKRKYELLKKAETKERW